MTETTFAALLAVIIIPYGLMILVLLWNVIGPVIRARRAGGREQDYLTSPE